MASTPAAADDTQRFGVTAGADAQAPIDEDGSSTGLLEEQRADEFPTRGTATLRLPPGSEVRIDAGASDPRAAATGDSGVTVTDAEVVDDRTVSVEVEATSDDAVEAIRLEGLRFVVPDDAGATTATWSFGDAAAPVRFEPERLVGYSTSARIATTTSAGGDPVEQVVDTTVAVVDQDEDSDDDEGGDGSSEGGDGDGSSEGGDGDGGSDGGDGDGSSEEAEHDDGGGGDGNPSADSAEDSDEADGDAGTPATDGSSAADHTGGERRSLEDADPGGDGVTVTFESVPVSSITFHGVAVGEVTVVPLDTLPGGVPSPPGRTVTAVEIAVTDVLEDEWATVRVTVDASALGDGEAEGATIYHYDADRGSWEPLETEVVDSDGESVTFEATTRGFSPFALQTATADRTPTGTATDDGARGPVEAASIGGDPLVLLVVGLVTVTSVGIAARRLR